MSNVDMNTSVLFDEYGEVSLSASSTSTSGAELVDRLANKIMYDNDMEMDRQWIEGLIYEALPKLKPGTRLYGTSALKHQPIIELSEELFEL